MTTFEFFKNLYDDATGANGGKVKFKLADTTYKTVKEAMDEYFGAAYDFQMKKAGVDMAEVQELVEQKIVGHKYYGNWRDRQRGTTDLYFLTAKGMRQWYKMYFK